jgi:hypothetical protein
MATITIDTLNLANDLKSHGFSEDQASAVTRAIQSIDLAHIATKENLLEIKSEILKWMFGGFFGLASMMFALFLKIH